MNDGFIPLHGGFSHLKSYQKALVVYDGTKYFCKRFFRHDHRQTDQMEQAARSGKQNIVEGSLASATSKQSEVHLTNVAKASLGELREDFEDFLRGRGLPKWDRDHPEARQLRALSRKGVDTYDKYRSWIEHSSPEISANTLRQLVILTMYLLDRQIQRLECDFLKEGGIRERMTDARLKKRDSNARERTHREVAPPGQPAPECPDCGSPMRRRTARRGVNAGGQFWGCSRYPDCHVTRPLEEG